MRTCFRGFRILPIAAVSTSSVVSIHSWPTHDGVGHCRRRARLQVYIIIHMYIQTHTQNVQ